jgi:hypothetical protein
MTRRSCTFKITDVARAIRGAKAAGVEVQRIEIDKAGKIILFTGSVVADKPLTLTDELDREWAAFEDKHGRG